MKIASTIGAGVQVDTLSGWLPGTPTLTLIPKPNPVSAIHTWALRLSLQFWLSIELIEGYTEECPVI